MAGAALWLAWGGTAAAGTLPAVAMITDLHGAVAKVGEGSACALFAMLAPGDQLQLAAGARVSVVYLKGGARYDARGANLLTVGVQRASLRDGVLSAARTSALSGQLGTLDMRDGQLRQGAVLMRGGSTASPQGKVLSHRPVFSWPALATGATARLRLERADDPGGQALLEQNVEGTSLVLPDSVRLLAGHAYSWRLTVSVGDLTYVAHAPAFSLASQAEQRRFAQLAPPAGAAVSERLIYAKLLEQAELDEDAAAQWRQVLRLRPDLRAAAPRLAQ